MGQTTIFDMMYPRYKITKPIRLIEMFAGYGSQALALKYLGVPFENWRTCEWAVKSIQAYKDIHFGYDNTDYSRNMNIGVLSKDKIVECLYYAGISSNYNEPMSKEQIARLNENQLRTIFNNIIATSNMVNIQKAKGKDLEIVDTDKYEYIMTYSFPCQDLSLAGKGKGMSDTSTRSGMLWEVERILTECKELGTMPQILLMENVPQVHSVDNMSDFHKWQVRLEELGYKSYWQDLIATDYGIPQTRNRCFMVSILGNYSYTFPKPIPLEKKLKDMLEDNVDEKYYLSEKALNYVLDVNDVQVGTKWEGSTSNGSLNKPVAMTIGCRSAANQRVGITNYIIDNYDDEMTVKEAKLRIKNATKTGYLEATDGDGIDISSRMKHHRGNVQKGKTQTLTTMGGENNGVVVNMKTQLCNDLIQQGKVKENDVIRHSYTTSRTNDWKKRSVEQNNLSPTLDTRCDCLGVVTACAMRGREGKQRIELSNRESANTITTVQKDSMVANNLRIRKLTPRECFRLMGVKDEDFDKVKKNQSDASLYHLAGDSIVVNVLMAIFKELL